MLFLVLGNNEKDLTEDELPATAPKPRLKIAKQKQGEESQGGTKPGRGGFGVGWDIPSLPSPSAPTLAV